MIITYSLSYAIYQRNVRQAQLERAEKMVRLKKVKKQRKNPSDPACFIKVTVITQEGEIAKKKLYETDEEAVRKENAYDGFYAVYTNFADGSVGEGVSQRGPVDKLPGTILKFV